MDSLRIEGIIMLGLFPEEGADFMVSFLFLLQSENSAKINCLLGMNLLPQEIKKSA